MNPRVLLVGVLAGLLVTVSLSLPLYLVMPGLFSESWPRAESWWTTIGSGVPPQKVSRPGPSAAS